MIQISTKTLSVRFSDTVYYKKKMSQATNHILMIRPVCFGYNPETSVDNAFQKPPDSTEKEKVQEKALEQFNNFVSKLREAGVFLHAIEDTSNPHTPDSIFPNNWISFHEEDATICLYPMAACNRRIERKNSVMEYLEKTFEVKTILDLTRYEKYGKYLEGTGSMVLDREHHIAYASISERTDEELFEKFCKHMGFTKFVTFHSADENGKAIYHTNVVMSICDKYAVVCFDAIADPSEKEVLEKELVDSGKVVIKLAMKQMNSFAGNLLQVKGYGKKLCVMSTQAYDSLDFEQIEKIEEFDTILHSDLSIIENNGGGSARCMMAEVFLRVKE